MRLASAPAEPVASSVRAVTVYEADVARWRAAMFALVWTARSVASRSKKPAICTFASSPRATARWTTAARSAGPIAASASS